MPKYKMTHHLDTFKRGALFYIILLLDQQRADDVGVTTLQRVVLGGRG